MYVLNEFFFENEKIVADPDSNTKYKSEKICINVYTRERPE